jgi:hypothetical protein
LIWPESSALTCWNVPYGRSPRKARRCARGFVPATRKTIRTVALSFLMMHPSLKVVDISRLGQGEAAALSRLEVDLAGPVRLDGTPWCGSFSYDYRPIGISTIRTITIFYWTVTVRSCTGASCRGLLGSGERSGVPAQPVQVPRRADR